MIKEKVINNRVSLSQFQISNWDHCFWWAWINPLCKSGLDPVDCKSSWFHSSIKINNHLNILNHLPDADHLAPEVGVGAVAKSSGAPGWVGAANTVWVPRGAVAVGAVPAVYGSGHPPAPPHPCANPPRSLSRHQVPWQHGRTVAGLGSAVKGVRAAYDVIRLASGRGAASPVITHRAQAGPDTGLGSGELGDFLEDVAPLTLVSCEGAIYPVWTADTTLA